MGRDHALGGGKSIRILVFGFPAGPHPDALGSGTRMGVGEASDPPAPASSGASATPRKPNYDFERRERERNKAADAAKKAQAKADKKAAEQGAPEADPEANDS
ncbi:hypothetical protein [Allosphingosinicella deserti]|nr:hypothetical protein [Sphingomonas deserti]